MLEHFRDTMANCGQMWCFILLNIFLYKWVGVWPSVVSRIIFRLFSSVEKRTQHTNKLTIYIYISRRTWTHKKNVQSNKLLPEAMADMYIHITDTQWKRNRVNSTIHHFDFALFGTLVSFYIVSESEQQCVMNEKHWKLKVNNIVDWDFECFDPHPYCIPVLIFM